MGRNFTWIVSVALLLISCERIVDINLNDANPKIVIEANVHNHIDNCLVKISSTGNFFSAYTPNMISGAKLSLSNETTEYSFLESEDGIYILNKTGKLSLSNYKLVVDYDGVQYVAESQMPNPVKITYLNYDYKGKTLFYDAGYVVNYSFIDPKDEVNYYRVRYFLNGELQSDESDYFIITDEMFNGNSIQMQLHGGRFETGDTVKVELMSIDKDIYDYFNTLIEVISLNSMESAAPANPTSNFSNGVLGYFSAYSSDVKTIIIGKTTTGN